MKLYSVYDEKSESFGKVFCAINDFVAVRDFTSACFDENTMLFKYSDDFKLYSFGDFDDSNGKFSISDVPTLVITATQAINSYRGNKSENVKIDE